MQLVNHQQMASQRRQPKVRVLYRKPAEQHLIDRANDDLCCKENG